MSAGFSFEVPIRLLAGPNARLHWRAKAERVKVEKGAVLFCGPPKQDWFYLFAKGFGSGWRVKLTRLSPGKVDPDNLQGMFKAVRDQISKLLEVDDRSERLHWEYLQEKSKDYAVRIQVEALP